MLMEQGPLTNPGEYDYNRPTDVPIEIAKNGSYFYYVSTRSACTSAEIDRG